MEPARPAKRVLVCDDEPAMTRLIAEVLMSRGFEVRVENDPARVEPLLLVGRFDVLILDYMMPDLDGLELLERLRGRDAPASDVPAIVMTAKRLDAEERAALARARATVIPKPFRIDELVDRVRAAAGPWGAPGGLAAPPQA